MGRGVTSYAKVSAPRGGDAAARRRRRRESATPTLTNPPAWFANGGATHSISVPCSFIDTGATTRGPNWHASASVKPAPCTATRRPPVTIRARARARAPPPRPPPRRRRRPRGSPRASRTSASATRTAETRANASSDAPVRVVHAATRARVTRIVRIATPDNNQHRSVDPLVPPPPRRRRGVDPRAPDSGSAASPLRRRGATRDPRASGPTPNAREACDEAATFSRFRTRCCLRHRAIFRRRRRLRARFDKTFPEDSRRVRSEGARRETDPAPPWIAFARARSF